MSDQNDTVALTCGGIAITKVILLAYCYAPIWTIFRIVGVLFLFCAPTLALGDTSSIDQQVSQLIAQGKLEEAKKLHDQTSSSPSDRLFFDGRVLKAAGNYQQAIDTFREILRLDPGYINARRELAHTLLLARQYSASAFHFEDLIKLDQSEVQRKGYRHFLNVIDQNKPFGVSGQFALLPSTNINRGTGNSKDDGGGNIGDESRRNSGVGAFASISGFYNRRIGQNAKFTLRSNLSTSLYENKRYDSATGRFSVGYERATKGLRWNIAPFVQYNIRVDDNDSFALGARFGLQKRLNQRTTLVFSASHEYRKYPSLVNDSNDGPRSGASLGFQYRLRADLSFSGGVSTERNRPNILHAQYDEYAVFVGASKAWKGGLNTSLRLSAGSRDFIGDFLRFGSSDTSPRADDYYRVSISGYNSRWNYAGFTPTLSCSYTKNLSNVALFDYSATECKLAATRNF